MSPRSLLAVVALAAAGGTAVAAVVTAPDTTTVPAAAAASESAPGSGPAAGAAPRPAGPTGGRGPDAPPLEGELTADRIPVLRDAPGFVGVDGWLQDDGITSLDQLRGSVVVVQVWTFSCRNCTATLPNLRALATRHADRDDVAIIGIHSPEFAFEEDPAAVEAAVEELDVTWPVALDGDRENFRAWQPGRVFYWPRTFVVDRDGRIRFDHIGEGRYDELNATVDALLAEA